jgi:predicted  nucleic acid-binding Zn-ribbon protein
VPVETGRSGGEFTRHYRGGTHLGIALQWDCPSCGTKHETANAPIEQGCPTCGAGVPGVAGKAAPSSSSAAPLMAAPVVPSPARQDSGPVERTPGSGRPAIPAEQAAGVQTVYRLVRYTGSQQWIEATLRRSLVGYMGMGEGTITATMVDGVDRRQEDLLGMAGRQPGVWLGLDRQHFASDNKRSPTEQTIGLVREDMQRGIRALEEEYAASRTPIPSKDWPVVDGRRVPPTSSSIPMGWDLDPVEPLRWARPGGVTSPVPPEKETAPMPDNPKVIASYLVDGLVANGQFQGVYTLAMALNQFATVVEDESMERDKFWSPQQCLGVAAALLALIPTDWQPEPEAEEPPPPAPTGGL